MSEITCQKGFFGKSYRFLFGIKHVIIVTEPVCHAPSPKKQQRKQNQLSKEAVKRVKIEKIDNNKLKITLSCMEILQMNLDIHPNESTNSFLKLLNALETEHHFSVINQKIILEMIPGESDGCSIYLTTAFSEKKKQLTHPLKRLIFSFSGLDIILYAVELICDKFQGTVSIYRLDERYYLILYFETQEHFKTIRTLLSDLGDHIGNPQLFESVLTEYGKPLCHHESMKHFSQKDKKEIFSKK